MAYPTSIDTDADLYLTKNQLSTILVGSLTNVATTIPVTSTTGFPTVGVITIDSEVIKYTSLDATNFLSATRGFDGTGATTHSGGALVKHAVTAIHHNALKDSLIAVETDVINNLRTNLSNIVINGGFEVWQRGTSFANPASNAYTSDRWRNRKSGGTLPTVDISQDSANADAGSRYCLKADITGTGATSPRWAIQQVTEDSQLGTVALNTRTITFSARVKTTMAGVQPCIRDGAGTATFGTTHTGSGNYETLSVTATVVCTFGQSLVTAIGIGEPINAAGNTIAATGVIYIDNSMLVFGSSVIPFTPTDAQVEFARCQRFYQRIGGPASGNEITASGQWWSTTLCDFPIRFPVVMRVTPTLTVAGTSGWKVYNNVGSALTPTGIAGFATGPAVLGLTITVASGGVAGNGTILYATAPTSYFELSAEL